MIRMEMQEIELKPVSRRGLMQMEAMADMTESQMFEAIESFKEYITGDTWGRWLEQWNDEEREEKAEAQYELDQRINAYNREVARRTA